ncbi:MAG: carboxypeptidase-like regulatory domain-containing protein [Bacteroidia bacterium]
MKVVLHIAILLIVANPLAAQVTGYVKDSKARQPIPYVNIWVENENVGTSADAQGNFTLPAIDSTKRLVFSAMGYETRKVSLSRGIDTVYLQFKAIQLAEAVFIPKRGISERTIGNIDKKDVDVYFSTQNKPWILAKSFPYSDDYKETPYLNSIRIITKSEIKNAKFNVRLYSAGEGGEPVEYIYNDTIPGYAKKGKRITEVDLSNLAIQFPDDGFFVAIECLIIEENRHESKGTEIALDGPVTKKKIWKRYQPSIGSMYRETDENTWYYSKGNWRRGMQMNIRKFNPEYAEKTRKIEGMYAVIPMELVLTD